MGETLCLPRSALSLILWGETRKGAVQETCRQMPTLSCAKNYRASNLFLLSACFTKLLLFCNFSFDIYIFDFNKSSIVSWANGGVFNLLIFSLSRSRTCSLWQKRPYALAPSLICDLVVHAQQNGAGQNSVVVHRIFSCDTDVMFVLRSSKASQNHWIYCECTRTDWVEVHPTWPGLSWLHPC